MPRETSIRSPVRSPYRCLYRGQVHKRELVRVDLGVKRKPAACSLRKSGSHVCGSELERAGGGRRGRSQ